MSKTVSIDPVIRLFKFNKLIFLNSNSFCIDDLFKEIEPNAVSVTQENNYFTIRYNVPASLLRSKLSFNKDDLFVLYVQKNRNEPNDFIVYSISIDYVFHSLDISCQSVIKARCYYYIDLEDCKEVIKMYFRDYIAEKSTDSNAIDKLGEKNMRIIPGTVMPKIKNVYYTDRYTTVEWDDDVKTTVGCKEGEEFNKEIGLSMAISKRYFGDLYRGHARSEFKHTVENAHDMSKKVTASKARKKAKQKQNKED